MYLVTGATGNVGSELVRALADDGQRVRALVRSLRVVPGADAVVGDLTRPDTWADALTGVRGIFLLPGYRGLDDLLAMAHSAGVEHVTLLSGNSASSGDLTNAVSRYMIQSERAVLESGLAWTFVRSGAFMSNALRWLPQLKAGNEVRVPFPTVRVAPVDPYDIAAVVARSLTEDGHDGAIHHVSGPTSLLPEEQLAILAHVLHRDLTFVGLTNDEARVELEATMPQKYVEAFFDFYVDGSLDESQVLPTVQAITGRAPRTFEQWTRAHAEAFD